MINKLERIFNRLYKAFGPQHWWPAKSSFEVIVGAILTQSTNWGNAKKAIFKLAENKLISPGKLKAVSLQKLSRLIKSSGYYHQKARRLKSFLKFFFAKYRGKIERMRKQRWGILRQELLGVKGIGPETADSILLYALNKPVFVVDAYSKRILLRHKLINARADYAQVQNLFMLNLKSDFKMFNEFHALLVKLAKDYCHKQNPQCEACPLDG